MQSVINSLVLAATVFMITGCASYRKDRTWQLMDRHADPNGRIRLTPSMSGTDVKVESATVACTGRISGEMEVERWNVYKVVEIFEGAPDREKVVVDPFGHPYVGADPELTADSIKGISREPTGTGRTPLDASRFPAVKVRWTLLGPNGAAWHGTGESEATGRFKVVVGTSVIGEAAIAPATEFSLHVRLEVAGNARGTVDIETAEIVIPREVFVRAVANGR